MGVLKVLEELKIPVDVITGTSMGSAVGGLYATGLTAAELETIFTRFDWVGAFTDSPPRRDLSFRRKEDDRTFLVKARIGLDGGKVQLPRGFVEGQNFVMELRKLSHVTESLPSFDQLPIPFRAMATDLETARPVVLDKGDLVMAIRASIAVAPLFSPVKMDGRLLVDGGYLRNIPVKTAKDMGADRLIAVNIGTPLSQEKDMRSVFDVFSQVSRLGGQVQDRRQIAELGPEDLLILPDLEGYAFTDFAKIPEIVARGEAAARAVAEPLKNFSVSEEDYRRWRGSLAKGPTLPVVDSIEFVNGTRISDNVFLPFIRQRLGALVDPAQLQKDLAQIYGFGYFEFLNYHVDTRDGKKVLVVDAPRKSWGPDYLRLGLKIAEEFDGDSAYAVLARYQKTEINRYGGELNVDGNIGTNSKVDAEWYQPIGQAPRWLSYGAPYFASFQGGYGQENDPVRFSKGSEIPFEFLTGEVSPSVGRTLGNWGRIRTGLKWDWETYQTPLISGEQSGVTRSDVFLRLDLDTLDAPGFPRHGIIGSLEGRTAATVLGGEARGSLFDGNLGAARSWGADTFQARLQYGTNLNSDAQNPHFLRLGGFLNLSGFSHNSLIGTETALTQLRWNRNVGSLAAWPLYVGSAVEWGGAWNRQQEITLSSGYWCGSLYATLDSGLGPTYLALSQTEQGIRTVYLYVGQAF
ncbi:MAG: patatin-like phospholipase family protein [Elusimicrobia bacterium]|nr:patatin-like phospholipase family protein [Elusimicrobiota bacterium]